MKSHDNILMNNIAQKKKLNNKQIRVTVFNILSGRLTQCSLVNQIRQAPKQVIFNVHWQVWSLYDVCFSAFAFKTQNLKLQRVLLLDKTDILLCCFGSVQFSKPVLRGVYYSKFCIIRQVVVLSWPVAYLNIACVFDSLGSMFSQNLFR